MLTPLGKRLDLKQPLNESWSYGEGYMRTYIYAFFFRVLPRHGNAYDACQEVKVVRRIDSLEFAQQELKKLPLVDGAAAELRGFVFLRLE
jgi:nicotinic acid phosphoribosyltransferase